MLAGDNVGRFSVICLLFWACGLCVCGRGGGGSICGRLWWVDVDYVHERGSQDDDGPKPPPFMGWFLLFARWRVRPVCRLLLWVYFVCHVGSLSGWCDIEGVFPLWLKGNVGWISLQPS